MGREQSSAAPRRHKREASLSDADRNVRMAADYQPAFADACHGDGEPASGPFGLKLERFKLYGGRPPLSIRTLMANKRTFEPGVQLMQQGDAGGVAYIIEQGWTFSSNVLRNGSRQILDVQIPGDVAGLHSLPVPSAANDVTAITKVHVIEIQLDAVMNAIASDPDLAAFIFWLAARQNDVASERIIDIGRRTSVERMAHFILELATRLRLAGIGTDSGFPCPLTQYLLGDALGLTSIHVNRVLRELRTSGLAHHQRGWISLLNADELSTVAGFSSAYLRGAGAESTDQM
jgi:CRP-like cAMP-binding protein